jgi:hypothetical protein
LLAYLEQVGAKLSNPDFKNISDFVEERQRLKNKMTITGICLVVLVVVALGLESYFNSHPTIEELYSGTSERTDTLWVFTIPILVSFFCWIFVISSRIRKLDSPRPPYHKPESQQSGSTTQQQSKMAAGEKLDKIEQLERLSRLKENNALTLNEYESLKKEILG